jgi:small-conductance mechanosensitive channel
MDRRKIVLASLILITSLIFLIDLWYEDIRLERVFFTTLSLAASYFLFEFVIRNKVINRVSDAEGRYHLSKVVYLCRTACDIVIIVIIWIQDIQALILSLGLIAAAFTITMQDVAKNSAGGSSIFMMDIYRVGDRIELSSKREMLSI